MSRFLDRRLQFLYSCPLTSPARNERSEPYARDNSSLRSGIVLSWLNPWGSLSPDRRSRWVQYAQVLAGPFKQQFQQPDIAQARRSSDYHYPSGK